jgi:serine/threonine protein kinase
VVDSEKSPSLIDAAIGESYQPIETLAGRTGEARYLARRLDTGILVELWVLTGDIASDDNLVHALRDQAARLARASHPRLSIATVYECERTPSGAVMLAMEHPEGPTLADTLRREGPFAPDRALHVALEIAEAIEFAHNLGLVHGGLRPENVVLVGAEPTVMLTHFGLDLLIAPQSTGAHNRRSEVGENAVYRAPEQASGETTERSDIYAVGAVLYEMLTGTPPSAGAVSRHRLRPAPWRIRRSEVSRNLERIVAGALETAPDRRPPYMSVLCNDLSDEINLYRQRNAAGPGAVAGRSVGKRTVLFVGCSALAVSGLLAIWFARPLFTLSSSTPLSRSELTVPAPMPARPAAATRPDDASRPSTGPGDSAPGPGSPGRSTAAGGPSGSLPESAARKPVASATASDPLTRPTPRPGSSLPGTPTPLGAARTGSGASDSVEPARPRPRPEDIAEPRAPRPPVAARPETSRDPGETGEDPGAIIDWLLTEGSRQQR